MIPIYGSKNIKLWDEFTILNEPIASIDLMERAAKNCVKHLLGSVHFNEISIFCGVGNNGADGLAIARILSEQFDNIVVNIIGDAQKCTSDFKTNLDRLPQKVNTILSTQAEDFDYSKKLILDCIFGSGLNRPIEAPFNSVIQKINASSSTVVAIDMPSGLYVESNRSNNLDNCVQAALTLSIQSPKLPFFFKDYYAYVGEFKCVDIGLSKDFKHKCLANFIVKSDVKLKLRPKYSHKGTQGKIAIIGGRKNMVGAGIIAAKAAFNAGCGYVFIQSSKAIYTPLMSQLPEAIWMSPKSQILPEANALVIGPGLGQDQIALNLLEAALKLRKPIVIDADAINLLAENKALFSKLHTKCILTPHYKEFERLVGATANSDEERLKQQQQFATKYGCNVLRKGPHSCMTNAKGQTYFNSTGNPSMATAGMGDALSGIIGSLLAQGYTVKEALLFGPYIHGAAADRYATNNGHIGLTASKLINYLPNIMNELVQPKNGH
jgi:NAD(P)H-hydrate epimerase